MPVDPMSDPRWEAFIADHPEASIYHHPAWLDVLSREYKHPSFCLACIDKGGRFRGVLPLIETRGVPFASGTTGRRLSSLPRTPVSGLLAADDQAAASLLRAAIERVDRDPGVRLELRLASPSCDGLVEGLASVPWQTSYRLDLPPDPASLRFGDSRNNARIKWALGKAARHSIVVRSAQTLEDLAGWYQLYLRTIQAHASPTRPYRFFTAAWQVLRPRGLMRLLVAEQVNGGRRDLVAGSIFLMFGRTVFYAFNGSSQAGLMLRANDVIQWQAIQDACRSGFRCYDMGEVPQSQEGLHDFKRKWGAEPYRAYRYYYPAAEGGEAAARDSHGIAGRLKKAAWRRLPRRVAARLSDWLFGYV
jgi:CelD/BcsL family acetyltransferase involved in cellulose biosynthesis